MNDWVPVGERLPKKPGHYLVTEVLDTVTPTRIVTDVYYSDGVGWQTNDQCSTVVAWMEKPRAYNGDSRGNIGYSDIIWHMSFSAEEVAVLDMIADLMQAASANLDVGMSSSQRGVYNKIKDMAEVSKTYTPKEKSKGDWVVRDKEPL